jgi:hypothetical protein
MNRLGRAVVVVHLDEVAFLNLQLRHILRVHLEEWIREAIHHELIVLIEIGALPGDVRAPVVDEVRPFLHFGFLAGSLEAPPLGLHEGGLTILRGELTVGIEALASDDLATLRRRGQRSPTRARNQQRAPGIRSSPWRGGDHR